MIPPSFKRELYDSLGRVVGSRKRRFVSCDGVWEWGGRGCMVGREWIGRVELIEWRKGESCDYKGKRSP
jgi:hypothetical protein